MSLTYRERPADGTAEGLLILHHGRGADEHDLLSLGDTLDPERRLHVVTPRAPLTLGGWPGYHWYVVPRVGYPDHDTFHAAYNGLAGRFNNIRSNYWTPENPTGTDPRPSTNGLGAYAGSRNYVDGSFVRIRDITFGYTLDDMQWFTVNALKSAFIPFDERLALINEVIKPAYAKLIARIDIAS